MSTPSTRTTRTGRRVVPTEKTADKEEKKVESPAATPTRASTRGAGRTPRSEESAKEKSPAPSRSPAKAKEKEEVTPTPDAPKTRRGLRSAARVSSGSADETATEAGPATKRAKIEAGSEEAETQPMDVHEEETELLSSELGGQESEIAEGSLPEGVQISHEIEGETDDSQIFEAVAKMNAEAAAAGHGQQVNVVQVMDQRTATAVDSILPDNTTITIVQNPDGTTTATATNADGEIVREFEATEVEAVQAVDVNPPWNEQGCIICNVDITIENPAVGPPKSDQLKDFFIEFFSVGDQISLEDENTFPFCAKCAEEMDGLLSVSQSIESMHKQFNKGRDSMAKKAIKTFLSRTKPNCLEEDAKAENYGFLDEDQKKSYKDQMFHLWKSRYELVQPGPKTPIMIRSMDSRGRVTVVRLNSHGQAVSDKFGGMRTIRTDGTPLGGMSMGRLLTNGEDDDIGGGIGGLEMYQCKECPKAFSAKSLLAYHERVHTGELPYECDQCGKAFSVPHYLVQHMKTHSGEKPYKCMECGKGFAQRGGLVTHSLVHTGAKPFSCQICGKSFRQKYHLTQHNLIHSGVKPFSCELCGKAFNVKMNLREHMRRHTGDRPYKCPYCTTVGFFRKKMLKEHIVKAHPQRPMPEELMAPEPSTSYATDDSNLHDHEDEDLDDLDEENEEIISSTAQIVAS